MFHNFFVYHISITFSWLETLAKFAEIVTAGSFIVALGEYFRRKRQDTITAVADQISFFNEKVLVSGDKFINLVRDLKKDPKYQFKRIKIDVPDFKYVLNNHHSESKEQYELALDPQIFSAQMTNLNYLEELAIRILNYDTSDQEALNSIKWAFVELVEINATLLLVHKDLLTGGQVYKDIMKLYLKWKDDVDRTPLEEKVKDLLAKTKK
jgi:hypothetical protein